MSGEITPQVVIENFRGWAKPEGYAISVHGTLERDIDLVANIWTAYACHPLKLVGILMARSGAICTAIEQKPSNRFGFILQGYGGKMIDLSVVGRGSNDPWS